MLRVINYNGTSIPTSYPVHQSAQFQAGQMGQLTLSGNQVVIQVSDGTAPFGIIDDYKTTSFSANAIDETTIIPVHPSNIIETNGTKFTKLEIRWNLKNAYIYKNTFATYPLDLILIPTNGVIIIPELTPLNFSTTANNVLDAIRIVSNYSYQIQGVPGEDTTAGSGFVTIWGPGMSKIIVETDQFEPNQRYPLNAQLFCSRDGKFTTKKYQDNLPGIGMVTGPPNSVTTPLQLMFY